MPGFRRRGSEIALVLGAAERALLGRMVPFLDDVDPEDAADAGARRLRYRAHPDDEEADRNFRELVGDDLEGARTADRRRFLASLERGALDGEDADAWLRVLGEARLVLAARLGIEDEEGWETRRDGGPEMALLALLGLLQEDLVRILLDAPPP
jgi:hypothetical protein